MGICDCWVAHTVISASELSENSEHNFNMNSVTHVCTRRAYAGIGARQMRTSTGRTACTTRAARLLTTEQRAASSHRQQTYG